MADEYIKREDAIDALTADALERNLDGVMTDTASRYHRAAQRVVSIIPAADVVEVVRCKDCLNWKKDAYGGVCDRYGVRLDKDWFCAGGEREVQDG
jgi:hypothetical protein